jgi:SAM-dependent methyltransferase
MGPELGRGEGLGLELPAPAPDGWPGFAEFLGRAYLRYSFTKGTQQEAAFLVDTLDLQPGMRVLDVGCGPGRHAHALAERGLVVHGVDVSPRFIELAREQAESPNAAFEVGDARDLRFDREFDLVMSLCQGGFGLVGEDDAAVLDGMARAVKPTGRVVLSAFSSYFAVRFLEPQDDFDAATGQNREHTTLTSEAGETQDVVLTTTCFTPRELRLLCRRSGLAVEHLWSVTPGDYAERPPGLDRPEFLVVARPG